MHELVGCSSSDAHFHAFQPLSCVFNWRANGTREHLRYSIKVLFQKPNKFMPDTVRNRFLCNPFAVSVETCFRGVGGKQPSGEFGTTCTDLSD